MARGPVRKPEERRMLYLLEMAGFTLAEVNSVMVSFGYRPVPRTTYEANMRNEVPLFRRRPKLFEKYTNRPVPYGDWKKEWKRIIAVR